MSRYWTREELEDSPTRRDGISPEREAQMRRQYVGLINDVCLKLRLTHNVSFTATVLCHRFFAVKSMVRNDRYLIAAACLFLGCKVEEHATKVARVVHTCEQLRWQKQARLDPSFRKWEDRAHLERVVEEVLVAERSVLYTLSFSLDVSKPFQRVVRGCDAYLNSLGGFSNQRAKDLVQVAWNFANDSAKSLVSLRYHSDKLAAAGVFLSALVTRVDLPAIDGHGFYKRFKITAMELQDICDQILGVYEVLDVPKTMLSPVSDASEATTDARAMAGSAAVASPTSDGSGGSGGSSGSGGNGSSGSDLDGDGAGDVGGSGMPPLLLMRSGRTTRVVALEDGSGAHCNGGASSAVRYSGSAPLDEVDAPASLSNGGVGRKRAASEAPMGSCPPAKVAR